MGCISTEFYVYVMQKYLFYIALSRFVTVFKHFLSDYNLYGAFFIQIAKDFLINFYNWFFSTDMVDRSTNLNLVSVANLERKIREYQPNLTNCLIRKYERNSLITFPSIH